MAPCHRFDRKSLESPQRQLGDTATSCPNGPGLALCGHRLHLEILGPMRTFAPPHDRSSTVRLRDNRARLSLDPFWHVATQCRLPLTRTRRRPPSEKVTSGFGVEQD